MFWEHPWAAGGKMLSKAFPRLYSLSIDREKRISEVGIDKRKLGSRAFYGGVLF